MALASPAVAVLNLPAHSYFEPEPFVPTGHPPAVSAVATPPPEAKITEAVTALSEASSLVETVMTTPVALLATASTPASEPETSSLFHVAQSAPVPAPSTAPPRDLATDPSSSSSATAVAATTSSAKKEERKKEEKEEDSKASKKAREEEDSKANKKARASAGNPSQQIVHRSESR